MNLFEMLGGPRPLNVVVVQTKSGGTIKGVLVDRTRDSLVLRAASVHSLGTNNADVWTKAVGDLVVPLANLDYYQQALALDVLD